LGVFEEQILLAVTRLDGSGHGMAVRRELERLTERDLAVGAVYATLDRLEAKGFVRSRRAMIDDGERRVITTTASGARALASSRAVDGNIQPWLLRTRSRERATSSSVICLPL
jgi:PadR family transcriptional regulator PadR